LWDLQVKARITIEPENIPLVPIPAIALPTINALLVGASAQIKELDGISFLLACCVIFGIY